MFDIPLVASAFWHTDLWLALPVIVAVSLVYAATRHERMAPILAHACRTAGWIVGFMLALLIVLEYVSSLTPGG
jgi:cytochrome c oxidase assembly factor CtaG